MNNVNIEQARLKMKELEKLRVQEKELKKSIPYRIIKAKWRIFRKNRWLREIRRCKFNNGTINSQTR